MTDFNQNQNGSWQRIPTPANFGAAPQPQAAPDAAAQAQVASMLQTAVEHHEGERFDEAETLYRQILAIDPNHTDAMHLLGLIAYEFGQYQTACDLIMAAITRNPNAFYYYNLGNVMQAYNRPAAAAECFRQALTLQPDYVDAHNNLGNALRALKDHHAAVQSFCQAINLKPDHARAYNNLANTLMELDELEAAIEAWRNAIALRPDFAEPRSNLLFALNYQQQTTPQAYLDEVLKFGDEMAARATPFDTWFVDAGTREGRPLRVGIVSGDLKKHPVGYFIESVLANLDASRVQLVAYPTRDVEDELTARIKPSFSAWTSLAGVSDEAAAQRIRNDAIDVLIDASGHSTHNRLPLFAWKPAPVQVTWPGYFASTGVRAIDYILGDAHVLPEAEEAHFVEKPWRLPDSYLCFTPPTDHVETGALPMLANGHVTFGYFGNVTKITDHVVGVWSTLLEKVQGSVLFLKSGQFDDAHVRDAFLRRFATRGIPASRLIIEGRSARGEYFAAYRRVDMMLSPFPYGGGTTTAEAFWMGVPVLARHGDRFVTHIAETICHAAGLADWIAADDTGYVEKAVAFAADSERLSTLRSALRAQLLDSPLCDAARFARNLEAALHGMWEQRVAQGVEAAQ
ncbi:tetratricopeptide repeat protein [Paraburkholderia azotifigens]|uniref:protein O-GlcNAc transferase n=1 Tax=Paraburkholderia azotifigens TaxID=2057004 RepID=A0A5C6VXI7_9BURK|nr:tetratricopeptide repeat protein [Paraburkholderia azotifigens]TXC88178.1 tetratricopeptide repeat protein [Paraburkholderia azotifigens]